MVANNSSRIEWIDAAKGIGIWLVVTGHLLSGNSDGSRTIGTIIWVFHMPLFFFLSGITFKAPDRSYRSWAWGEVVKNIYSIVVPYLFFSFVSIAFWLLSDGGKYEDRNVPDAAWAVLYGISGPTQGLFFNVPLWFFTCLFSVKLIFLGLGAACNYRPFPIMVYSVVLAIFAHLAFYALPVPRLPWNFDVAFIALIFYSAGYLLSEYKIISKLSGKGNWLVLFIGIFH